MDGKTGAAFVAPNLTSHIRLANNFSVFSAELTAIYEALRFIRRQNIHQPIICSDSKSSLLALAANHDSSQPIIYKIRIILNTFSNDFKITFLWIPGHSGIHGNDLADEAAKRSILLPERDSPCPVTDALNSIHSSFSTLLQDDWDRQNHFHMHQIKPTLQHWPSSQQNTRLKEILLARLRLGHTKLTHAHIIQNTPPATCHRCNVRYTISHFLFHCPLYEDARLPLLRHAAANRLPLTLASLLGDSYPGLIDLLF